MAQVILEGVKKVFPGSDAATVHDLSLRIEDGEFLVLVGPSGCGKSTTLNMIAGLERVSGGTIRIGERVVNDVPVKDRDIAMVFQNYALYPHMTVYKNMAFALKLRGMPKGEIDARIREAAEILGLSPLLQRLPEALSGGQRQRVAVGRAIVRKPQVFLFDEPLSNLDAKLRVQMRVEINELHNRLKTTMIYVTHDQIEAMTMGDRIVVMKDGRVQQVADPVTLYDAPDNRFVAGFIGTPPMNFFEGTLRVREGRLCFEEGGAAGPGAAGGLGEAAGTGGLGEAGAGAGIRVPLPEALAARAERYRDRAVTLGLRPEDIGSPVAEAQAAPTRLHGRVKVVEIIGPEAYVHLDSGASTFVARVDSHRRLAVGDDAALAAVLDRVHLFDRETEAAIR